MEDRVSVDAAQMADDPRPEPISAALETLANEMVDYGLESLATTGKLTTMLSVEDESGHRESLLFEDDSVEECLHAARDLVRSAAHKGSAIEGITGRPVRYAIAYDGAVRQEMDGPYLNALLVEYGEKGISSGYSAYLLYKKAGRPQDFVWTDPAAAGETELLV